MVLRFWLEQGKEKKDSRQGFYQGISQNLTSESPKEVHKSPKIRQSSKISKNCILARIFGLRQGYKDKSCPGQENKETRT